MLEIAIETSSYLQLLAAFKAGQPSARYILPKLSLLFDTIHYFGNPPGITLLEADPYGQFSDISDELFGLIGSYPAQSEEQIMDVKKAFGESPDSNGGHILYSAIRALLAYAKERACYLYVPSRMRESFIEFCVKYEPDYLQAIKEGFLICSILEYVFNNEIPAFDPVLAQDALKHFKYYRQDFQSGILSYLAQFKGHYVLSRDQERYIREYLAREEKKLLDLLKPENLRKFDSSGTIRDFLLGLLPYPLDTIHDIVKEIREMRDFKNANLDFILSLTLLKQLSNIKELTDVDECTVCALSLAEIEKMSEKESDEVIHSHKLCTEHIVAYLNLRKLFGLFGKQLLKEMKRLDD